MCEVYESQYCRCKPKQYTEKANIIGILSPLNTTMITITTYIFKCQQKHPL